MSSVPIPILSVRQISKFYENGLSGLETMSLEIQSRDRLGIVGETGSGKSTLLKIIGGLLQADKGEVLFKAERVKGPEETLIPGHQKIAYLSQSFELPKFITVHEHLHDSYLIASDEAEQIYDACDVSHLLTKKTSSLSGGEKQRVALAKILLKKPEVLLLDEPFSNLDFNHKRVIKGVINRVEDTLNTTIVLVAHDPLDVLSWASRVLVLSNGRVVQEASPQLIYNQPKDEYVAGLFGAYNLVSRKEFDGELNEYTSIEGIAIVRPENFKLSDNGIGLQGRVVDVRFHGAYDELSVSTANGEFIVRIEANKAQLGQEVRLVLKS